MSYESSHEVDTSYSFAQKLNQQILAIISVMAINSQKQTKFQ